MVKLTQGAKPPTGFAHTPLKEMCIKIQPNTIDLRLLGINPTNPAFSPQSLRSISYAEILSILRCVF